MAVRKPEGQLAIEVERKAIVAAAELAGDAAERKTTVAALGCVRLQARGGHVALTGTDMDLQVAVDVPATVEVEGEALVDAQLLVAALKAGQGEFLRLVATDADLRIEGGATRATLGLCPDPFPEFPVDADGIGRACLFRGDALQRALARVKDAVSREETRYHLNGAFLEIGEAVTFTATDGHLLHHVVAAAEIDEAKGEGGRASGIIPRRTMAAIGKLPDSVTLQLLPTTVVLTAGSVTLTSRLIDGSFPDWRRVVPKLGRKHRVELARAELAAAIGRVAWAAGDGKGHAILLVMEGSALALSAVRAGDHASASTEIAAECTQPLGEVGFNARLLAASLDAIGGDKVILEGDGPAAPWLLTLPAEHDQADDRFVVMPMRV